MQKTAKIQFRLGVLIILIGLVGSVAFGQKDLSNGGAADFRIESPGGSALSQILNVAADTNSPQDFLDTSFGTGGIAPLPPATGESAGEGIVQQQDGKLVVCAGIRGNADVDFYLVRYNPNGSIDTTFGTGGAVTTNINGNDEPTAGCVIQPDGKILVGGWANNMALRALARYNPNGSLDATFGTGGVATVPIGSPGNDEGKILVQPDGKILFVGTQKSAGDETFGLIRFNPNGSLDTSFGTAGIVTTDFGAVLDRGYDGALLPDGKILAFGYSANADFTTSGCAVARYNQNGSLDTTFFGGAGKFVQTLSAPVGCYQGFAQPDGKFVIGGRTFAANGDIILLRYQPDGTSVDTTFGGGSGIIGLTITSGGVNQREGLTSLLYAYGTNGRISVSGWTCPPDGGINCSILTAQFLGNGALDTSFGSIGGAELTNVTAGDDKCLASTIQFDGKVVCTGYRQSGAVGVLHTQRYRAANTGRKPLFDFDVDRRADISVYRPSTGVWYRLNSATGFTQSPPFGAPTDKPVPADYDGDGRTDLAVYRPSTGVWYIIRSTAGFIITQPFGGAAGDVAVPQDFDGDGRAELVIYRPTNGTWYVLNLFNNNFTVQPFGTPEDKPVPADFDGDGRSDFAVYRPSNGIWYLLRSSAGFTGIQFGTPEDRPIVGDYDGDGRADQAVFRPSTGVWYLLQSTTGFRAFPFGEQAGDQPAPADYDGDGRTDNAVYRPSTGVWFVQSSITNQITGVQFGTPEDKPIPNSYVP